jgi:hypothetical protein
MLLKVPANADGGQCARWDHHGAAGFLQNSKNTPLRFERALLVGFGPDVFSAGICLDFV